MLTYNGRDENNSCTSEAGTFRQYKLVHEIEVIERQIPNRDENRFIELIKTRDYISRFRGRSRSRLPYFKMYIRS